MSKPFFYAFLVALLPAILLPLPVQGDPQQLPADTPAGKAISALLQSGYRVVSAEMPSLDLAIIIMQKGTSLALCREPLPMPRSQASDLSGCTLLSR